VSEKLIKIICMSLYEFVRCRPHLCVKIVTPPSGQALEYPFFFFTPPSGRGLIFLGGHLPQTSGFRWAKQIFVANFHVASCARILSDRNIFCTLWGGRITAGFNAPGAFLAFFMVTCPKPLVFVQSNKSSSQILSNIFCTLLGEGDNGGV